MSNEKTNVRLKLMELLTNGLLVLPKGLNDKITTSICKNLKDLRM